MRDIMAGMDEKDCFRMLLLGSTVVTCSSSFTAALDEFHIFYVKDVPEVDSRPGAVRTGNLDIIWQLGYVRVAYGALNGERQCSWAAVPDCLVRFSWGEYCGSWVTFAWRFALSSLRSVFVDCRAGLL